MWRGIFFFIKLAILVAIAVWLAERPGAVSIEWIGYRVDTTVGLLLAAIFILVVVGALAYRFWRALRGAPRSLGRARQRSRRRKGYEALTNGLVAVAAGDAPQANKWAGRASNLLDEPPLVRLLEAQAAQLDNDEPTAKERFTEMLEYRETRFLGLRGLFLQAMRDGDEEAARRYLERARNLRPQTPWVLNGLFELSERTGDLDRAEETMREIEKQHLLPRPEANRKRAVVLVEAAEADEAAGDTARARGHLASALKLERGFVPAILMAARLDQQKGRMRRARKLLEQGWREQPHPGMVEVYLEEPGLADKPYERIKRIERLTHSHPDHPESRIALAQVNLDAELWGEARYHLKKLLESTPEQRVFRMMATLEEHENGDSEKAAEWLRRAEDANPDPAWICGNCGAISGKWNAHCGVCNAFDTLLWRSPRHSSMNLIGTPPVEIEQIQEGEFSEDTPEDTPGETPQETDTQAASDDSEETAEGRESEGREKAQSA
ncbi:heme biosynthesis protein HemY [Fodinicurvata fenggangensis]|uniref:heme biosynthesis protein HemY n=1 Tax=Fodinicurvata fenggangensis TaxID=1121830 RepID=UPI00068D3C9C|nr:heme biosynthesis HemY N-terminal domain-containing protein [Fodinicurvata fenggangensis]